jgi:sulfide:quinone oxidoreductase
MSKHITVIGGGFAALTAARCLRQHDSAAKITLLAPQPALTYLPSLIWLPSGKRKPKDLVVPLEKFFREQRIDFVAGEATGLSADGRQVETSAGPSDQ